MGASLTYVSSLPPLVNGKEDAVFGADIAAEVVGEAGMDRDPPPVMSAEDFAFVLETKPGAFVWMGIGRADEGRLIHTPVYDFNDEALPYGASYWARFTERFLAKHPRAPEGMPQPLGVDRFQRRPTTASDGIPPAIRGRGPWPVLLRTPSHVVTPPGAWFLDREPGRPGPAARLTRSRTTRPRRAGRHRRRRTRRNSRR